MTGQMLTPKQVAARLGVSYHAVLRAIDRGEIPATKVCNRLRIPEVELDQALEAARVDPALPVPVDAESRRPGRGEHGSLAALHAIEQEAA